MQRRVSPGFTVPAYHIKTYKICDPAFVLRFYFSSYRGGMINNEYSFDCARF